MINWGKVYKAFIIFTETVAKVFETIKKLCNQILNTQNKIDKTEQLRKSWKPPRKIIMKSQVNIRKPARIFARANL